MAHDYTDLALDEIFPEDRPESPPLAVATYTRLNGQEISIQLVNKHPLWGHVLYPTSICLSNFLTEHKKQYVTGRRVLELGAGGGLPSLICALEGARKTVVTDFPDASLLSNLQRNVEANIPVDRQDCIDIEGYTWGSKVEPLLALSGSSSSSSAHPAIDTILAADLVFNHSQHLALLKTCEACLSGSSDPVLLSFYAHHRPTPDLIAKDEGFVKLAEGRGWTAERIYRNLEAGPAFPADAGDLSIRSTVHGFKLVPPRGLAVPQAT